MPKVSIVMPAYNVGRFIGSAIDSVLAQTMEDFELLVVDDGSTDDTAAVCERYSDRRIRIIRQANRGLAGARNTGVRRARGTYVAFLDSDDAWHPEKLAMHCCHLDRNPRIGLSFSASRFMDEDGRLLDLYQHPKTKNVQAADILCRNPVGNGSAPVIRREALRDIERWTSRYGARERVYFDPDFRQSEDVECWTRIATTTRWRVEGIDKALTYYRVNSGGLSADIDKQLASWEKFLSVAGTYAPELVRDWGRLARAYQYRYLARRAIWSREPVPALRMTAAALRASPRILFRDPARTLATAIAAGLLALLPASVFGQIEAIGVAVRRRLATVA